MPGISSRLLPALAALLLLFSVSVSAAPGDKRKTLFVCGHPVYPPIAWTSGGRVHGASPELIKIIFEKLGYHVVLEQKGNWKRCLKEAEKGNVDIVAAAYKNKERMRYLAFSHEPVARRPLVFFYNKKKPVKFNTWADLKGKRMGIIFGDRYGTEADAYIKKYLRVEPVSSGRQNFEKLVSGRIDIMPLGKYGGLLQARKLGYADKIAYVDKPLVSENWYVGVSRKSPAMKYIPYLDAQLRQMRKSGEIDRMLDYYSKEYMKSDAGK